MPVFEYRCKDCDNKFEVFHKSADSSNDEIICPSCNSTNSKKLFSSFSSSFEGTANSAADYSDNSNPPYSGGCASGMCGIN